MPGTGCFLCSGTDHWAENCPEKTPPENKAHYDARIDKYKQWYWDFRIDAPQKQKLITMVNDMWRNRATERKAS